jgi:hypothetical protein
MTPRKSAFVWRLVIPVAIAVLPLSLVAQSGATQQSPDYVLKQESYQTPAKELADAVLAPRYLNVSLSNASPDKKWFLSEIGDGPVVMKTFSKPFHELGGQDHGPVAKETLLDLWARWDAWLDKYVKNPPKPDSAKKITTDQPMTVR